MRIIFATAKTVIDDDNVQIDLTLLPEDHENHDVREAYVRMVVSAKLGQQLENGHKTHADFGKGGLVEKTEKSGVPDA